MKMLVLCGALVAIAGPAAAEVHSLNGNPEILQTTVILADLDLGRPAGADASILRIRRAARLVCGPAVNPAELTLMLRRRSCLRQATDAAIRDIDVPMVTARYVKTVPAATLAAR